MSPETGFLDVSEGDGEDFEYVYVYGTLRPGGRILHRIPGVMYDLGSYPGVVRQPLSHLSFFAEKIRVDKFRLSRLDQYEGYDENDKNGSLYLRVPYLDGWLYVYNQPLQGYEIVKSGDWLRHRRQETGPAVRLLGDNIRTLVSPSPSVENDYDFGVPSSQGEEKCARM